MLSGIKHSVQKFFSTVPGVPGTGQEFGRVELLEQSESDVILKSQVLTILGLFDDAF
jgi:hypothetical protein